eukprot:gb/GEZN01010016.1/.p1 GENE.gb/GEZN01010016.1/~~gb/GEZN01010016.1/.p1  ORF type:complete len:190 (-),score=20.22 gb/GEZN01010016.1/:600-1169(-)
MESSHKNKIKLNKKEHTQEEILDGFHRLRYPPSCSRHPGPRPLSDFQVTAMGATSPQSSQDSADAIRAFGGEGVADGIQFFKQNASDIRNTLLQEDASQAKGFGFVGFRYESLGHNSGCRNTHGQNQFFDLVYSMSLSDCQQQCNWLGRNCFGVEYRRFVHVSVRRCELWKSPLGKPTFIADHTCYLRK